jgi:hypothetical protein
LGKKGFFGEAALGHLTLNGKIRGSAKLVLRIPGVSADMKLHGGGQDG